MESNIIIESNTYGTRLCIKYEGQELAANVSATSESILSAGDEEMTMDTCEVEITNLEDGITGEKVSLTDDIRNIFKKKYLAASYDKNKA